LSGVELGDSIVPSALGRGISQALENIDYSSNLPPSTDVPLDPRAFYQSFGPILHGKTNKPVKDLAPYQYETWELFLKQGRLLEIKAQKVGESTKWLIVDFQMAILPPDNPLSTRGYDTLILSQSREHAREHIRTLYNLIANSEKYSGWLIDRSLMPEEDDDYKKVLRSEQSKQNIIYIRNPTNERQPARIIGVSIDRVGSLASWKRIHHIHASDISLAVGDISEAFSMATSRLANTDGSMVVEAPPTPPQGVLYDMWLKYRSRVQLKPGDFAVYEIPATEAVKYGIISQSFLDSEKERMPANEYERLYLARFTANFGNVFSASVIEKAINLALELEKKYGEAKPRSGHYKSAGYDPAFGSSRFGECILQQTDGILEIIHSGEKERPVITDQAYDAAARIQSWGIDTVQIDASAPEFIKLLKQRIGERLDYENIEPERFKTQKIKPIPWNKEGRAMLQNAVILMERGFVAIHPRNESLLTSLRTAIAEDYRLDKDQTVSNDVFDAWLLSLRPFRMESKGVKI
jgi:hypothetical protein